MSDKYIDLTETIIKDLHLTDSEASGVGAAMSWLHMHQDQVPGRTITESESTPTEDDLVFAFANDNYFGPESWRERDARRAVAKIKADALREFVADARDLLDCSGDTRWKDRALIRADEIEGDDG